MNILERFLKYVQIETTSDPLNTTNSPSTRTQINFLKMLEEELRMLKVEDIKNWNDKYLIVKIPANSKNKINKIGFIAHVDTSPDFSAKNVKPQVIKNYQGQTILLGESGFELNDQAFPNLRNYLGQDLVTTDGTTLLGADDKAGVAEIMDVIKFIQENPNYEHGELRFAFTTDEEIGVGANDFPVNYFDADYAYTVDGGVLGELEYETFNAYSLKINIKGKNIHPGTAKDKMINAAQLAVKIHSMVPENECPEKTQGREGFYHLHNLEASVEEAKLEYIIRDHDHAKCLERIEFLTKVCEGINNEKNANIIEITTHLQYKNMGEIIENNFECVEVANQAMKNLQITPIIEAARGGTDGSKISFLGLPCPNIFAGGENMHGKFEFISVQTMEKAAQTILEIIKLSK